MPVRRDTFVDASLLDTYESTTELLHGHIELGAFKVWEDEPGEKWGIFWSGPLASSRYLFQFRPEAKGTRVEVSLWLGGALGPVHHLLRRRGNRKHVDKILSDLKVLAESDDESDDEYLDQEDERGGGDAG
jgi:hypothetical protein